MKRTITILLAACVVAIACFAYIHHTRKIAAQKQAEEDQLSISPDSAPTGSATNIPGNSPDLVHQLPPGASAIVFADVSALRAAPIGKELASLAPTSTQDTEYTTFVRATGFDYSRDLDRAALAFWPKDSPTTIVAFAQGKFNQAKIERYALRDGKVVREGNWKIFEVPETGSPRAVRFAFLSPTEIVLADGPEIFEVLGTARNRLDAEMSQRVARVARAPIYAAARTPDLAKDIGIDDTHSAQLARLLRSVHNITVSGQPVGQDLKVAATAESDSALNAFQLSTALEGLVWMGRTALADSKTQRQIGPQWPALDALLKTADISHDRHFVRLRVEITPQILRAAAGSSPSGNTTQ